MAALTLFPLQYKRQGDVPIDIDQTFATTSDRVDYLTSPRRYAGMLVVDVEEDRAYLLNAAKDAWLPIGGEDGLFMFQVGIPPPLGDHIHWALMTTAQAKELIHATSPVTPIGDVAQPSVVLSTELAGGLPGHTHDITVYFDYVTHTFVVTNITNNTLDNHVASLVGTNGPIVQSEDVSLGGQNLKLLNFIGAVVASSIDGGKSVTVSVPGVTVQDEGVSLGEAHLTVLNFTGDGITAASDDDGSNVQVSISLPPAGTSVIVADEGSSLGGNSLEALNFVGAGVTATSGNGGTAVTVTIPGGGGGSSLPTVYEYDQASVTMDPSHLGNIVRLNYVTTQTYTVTEASGLECPVGTSLVLTWAGIGPVTIIQGLNAIIYTPETLNIRKRYGQVTLTKMQAPNVWQIEGNLQSS